MGPLFGQGEKPQYHENLLLVRMRPIATAGPAVAAGALAATLPTAFGLGITSAPPLTLGMAAIGFYERAGLLRKVTPIFSRKTSTASERGHLEANYARTMASIPAGLRMAAALSAVAGVQTDNGRADTSSIVELEPGADIRELQLALANDPMVASVSRVPLRYLAGTRRQGSAATTLGSFAAAPPSAESMWNLKRIRWTEARNFAGYREPTNVKVAVLDTGIDLLHPDLAPQIKSYTFAYPDLTGAYSAQDLIGHGTHVAGTIAASINNSLGISGICQCEIHVWKIFDDSPDLVENPDGSASFVYYVDPVLYQRALLECADSEMDVVNLSIGGGGAPDPQEQAAFDELIGSGTTVVAAMGNERAFGSPTSYPAAIDGVIAVGASNLLDQIANFSNRGNHITLCAPGDAIWSTLPTYGGQTGWTAARDASGRWREGKPRKRETDYDAWPGTSMASPHVAAAVAVFLGNGGLRDPRVIKNALADSADKVAAMQGAKFDTDYGHGRLNLEDLVKLAHS